MATVEVSREDAIKTLERSIARDADAVVALYADDAVRYDPMSPQGMRGKEAVRKWHESMVKAFKDVDSRTVSVVSKGDMVAWEWVFSLTHSGPIELPIGTLAATNKRVTMNGATFYRFNLEGLIAEQRDYFDVAAILQQLGIKPPS